MVWMSESRMKRHIPLMLVTGFLGSGKTTLLNRLIRDPSMWDTAVAINEFGEVPVDQALIERASDEVIVLANGCLCCFGGGDLENSLALLARTAEAREGSGFNRLIIETSGLADPQLVLDAVLDLPIEGHYLWLDRIVTTFDALYGAGQIEQHREALRQLMIADSIVLTKTDLVTPEQLNAAREALTTVNSAATLSQAADVGFDPMSLCSQTFLQPGTAASVVAAWARQHTPSQKPPGTSRADHSDAMQRVTSLSLGSDQPVDWRLFQLWLGRWQRKLGPRLLRVKGIINVQDNPCPVVLHAVQTTSHVPVELAKWPDSDRTSRCVFILRDTDPTALQRSWETFLSDPAEVGTEQVY